MTQPETTYEGGGQWQSGLQRKQEEWSQSGLKLTPYMKFASSLNRRECEIAETVSFTSLP